MSVSRYITALMDRLVQDGRAFVRVRDRGQLSKHRTRFHNAASRLGVKIETRTVVDGDGWIIFAEVVSQGQTKKESSGRS